MALLLVAPLVFEQREDVFLTDLDGAYLSQLILDQFMWVSAYLELGLNPLQGLGNVFLPINTNLMPAFVLQVLFLGQVSEVTSYTIFAGELFLTAYLYGRICNIDKLPSLVGAWLLPILALWMLPGRGLGPFYGIHPHYIDLVFWSAILLTALKALARTSVWQNILLVAVVTVLPVFLSIASPVAVMVEVPVVTALSIILLLTSQDRRTFRWRVGALILALVFALGSGSLEFLVGNTFYTTLAFFPQELLQVKLNTSYISILFQNIYTGPSGPVLFTGAFISAAANAIFSKGEDRFFAITLLVLSLVLIGIGLYRIFFSGDFRGPQSIHFETSLWPLYAAYCAQLPFTLFRRLNIPWPKSGEIIVMIGGVLVLFIASTKTLAVGAPYILGETEITAKLKQEIGLSPGAPFRGRVATFTGTAGTDESGTSWYKLFARDTELVRTVGNDHRFVGLWKYGIPTLQEYSQYTTPVSYLLYSRKLARPQDQQTRNVTIVTRPDSKLLQALGVRYVLTEEEMPGPAKLSLSLAAPGPRILRLYELPAPNLGNYSPTETVLVSNASQALEEISKTDLTKAAIIAEDLPYKLQRAENSQMTFMKGGVRIVSQSRDGYSFLVLPLQFSNCLKAKGKTGSGDFRLVRSNLMETGILFSGDLDISVRLANGPFTSRGCRYEDFKEMKAFGLSAAARKFPIGATPE